MPLQPISGTEPSRESGQRTAPDHVDLIELLFFAYRDFTGDPDAILARDGFGRAHHRVIHFVGRQPGLTVADLLAILGITKQSLARVLRQLIDTGYVEQSAGTEDRRQRHLFLTPAGRQLATDLAIPQSRRIERALGQLDGADRDTIAGFLRGMLDDQSLDHLKVVHET